MTNKSTRMNDLTSALYQMRSTNRAVILILSFSLLLKIVLSKILTVHGDEGMYLYDASLILEGLHPHVDFHARSPVFLYFLSSFLFLFGKSVFVGRLAMALVSTVTSILIFKIGRTLFDEKIALISLAIFSLSPFTLMWSVIIATEVLQLTLVTFSLYIVIHCLKQDRSSVWYIIAGLVLGLSIFVRRTSGIIFIAESLLILYYLHSHGVGAGSQMRGRALFISTTKRSLLILIGSFFIFLPIFLFIVSGTDLQYAVDSFFSNAGVGGTGKGNKFKVFQELIERSFYLVFPIWIFLVASVRGILKADSPVQKTFDSPALPLIGIALFPLIILSDPIILFILILVLVLTFILRRSGYFLSDRDNDGDGDAHLTDPDHPEDPGPPVLFGGLIIVLAILYATTSSVSQLQSMTFLLFTGIILFIIQSNTSFGKDHPSIFWALFILSLPFALFMSPAFKEVILFMVISLSALILFDQLQIRSNLMRIDLRFPHVLLLLWFLSIFLFYLYYSMSQEIFMYELSAVASLIAGYIFYHIHKAVDCRSILTKAFFTLIIISFVSSSFYYVDFETDTTITKPWTVDEVANYINENTMEDEEIFTANMAIAIEADRPIVMNLSHPTIYCEDYVHGFPDFSVIDYPTPEEIIRYLDQNMVRYIVNDPLTNYYYFLFNDGLREYVMKNYIQVKEINDVRILLRSREGDHRLSSSLTDATLPFIESGQAGSGQIVTGYRIGSVGRENVFYRSFENDEISEEHQVTPVSQSHSHHTSGAIGPNGDTFLVWSENTSTYSNIFLSKRSSDGTSLIDPFPITSKDEMGTYALAPVMVMDSEDRLIIFWSWSPSREGFYDLYFAVLGTDGSTITGNLPLTNDLGNNFNPSVGIDENDRIHLVWQDGQDGTYRIKYASYHFDNGTMDLVEQTAPKVISSVGESVDPDISVGDDGVHVVWENSKDLFGESILSIRYIRLGLDGSIELPEASMTFRYPTEAHEEDHLSTLVKAPRVSSEDDTVVIVWQDNRWTELSDLTFWGYEKERDDQDVRYWNVYYKILNGEGEVTTNDTLLSYYESNSITPDVAVSGTTFHVVWADDVMRQVQILHQSFDIE